MADEKTSTAETKVTDYKVDDATVDQLERLTNFVKHMEVKKSIDFDDISLGLNNPESDLSRYLGKLLVDYYDHGLSYQDIGNLLEIVSKYNAAIDSIIKPNSSEDIYDYSKFLGFGKDTPIENSLAYYLALFLERNTNKESPEKSYIYHEYEYTTSSEDPENPGTIITNTTYTYKNIDFLEYKDQIIAASVYYLLHNEFTVTGGSINYNLATSGISIDTSQENQQSYLDYITIDSSEIDNNPWDPSEITETDTIYKYNLVDSKLVIRIPKKTNELIGNAIYTLINKEKFIVQGVDNFLNKEVEVGGQLQNEFIEKTSAFTTEGALAVKGALINIFDLQFDARKIPVTNDIDYERLGLSVDLGRSRSILKKGIGKDPVMVRVLIVYKELNPVYRRLLDCELVECAINSVISGNETTISTIFSEKVNSFFSKDTNTQSLVTPESLLVLRNEYTDNLLIGRSYTISDNLIYTTDKFRYQYGNPYTARVACESEIMKYYISDPDLINGYGQYVFEKNEINKFLDNYAQTRDYFYKVLLNESFINESEYSLYEKLFLSFWAIERTISGKVDNSMDIDSFDKQDIINFFRSYGLKGLADILDFRNFYDSEALSKRVIKHYTQLVSNKGSKKIIDVIVSVFSFKKNELEVYKDILLKDNKNQYGFVKVSYNSDNMIKDILLGLNKITKLETFVENDKYWNVENTPDELLDDLLIQNVESKYITPEYRIEISERYFKIRLIFAMLDYLIEALTDIIDENLTTFNSIPKQLITLRRMLYLYYIRIVNPEPNDATSVANFESRFTSSNFNTFKINDEKIEELLSPYYNDDASINKSNILRDFQSSILTADSINTERLSDLQDASAIEFFSNLKYLYKVYLIKKGILVPKTIFYNSGNENIKSSEVEIIAYFVDTIYNTLNTYIFDGYIYKNNFDATFVNKINDIFFNVFFINDSNNYDILINKPSEQVEEPSDYSDDAILEQVERIKDLIGTDLTVSLEADENRLVAFLNEVIKYFISYTAEAKDTVVLKRYDTLNENLIMRDKIKITSSLDLLDSYFYDDALKIEIKDRKSNTNGGNNE